MTQGAFAERMGLSQPSVSDWERGETSPSAEQLPKIAAVLQCSVEELVMGVDPSYDESAVTRQRSSYTPSHAPVTDPKRGKKLAPMTSPVPPDRVQGGLLVGKSYEHATGGKFVEDAHVRSPIAIIAVELTNHVAELRARADAIAALVDRLATDVADAISPRADRISRRTAIPRQDRKRSTGTRGKL